MSARHGERGDVVLPARPAAPGSLVVPGDVLLEVLAATAAADSAPDLAAAVLAPLVRLPGVRAALVARAPRRSTDLVVLASDGYGCSTMSAGAVLPLGAGLPVTEAVRTASVRVVGTGPSWVAVPAGPGAALLLSLDVPPPGDDGVALLARLGVLVGPALQRSVRADAARVDLLVLEEGLTPHPPEAAGLLVDTRPCRGPLSGDVVELVDTGAERWLLVADVGGSGHAAAVGADRLHAAFHSCLPGPTGPSQVLARLDRALPPSEEGFATALVLRVTAGGVCMASAGHPAPLLVPGGRVRLPPSEPLGLRLSGPWRPAGDVSPVVPAGVLLLVATDGLVDRGVEVDLDAVVGDLPSGLDAAGVVTAVRDACAAAGPAQDDATLVVLAV